MTYYVLDFVGGGWVVDSEKDSLASAKTNVSEERWIRRQAIIRTDRSDVYPRRRLTNRDLKDDSIEVVEYITHQSIEGEPQ